MVSLFADAGNSAYRTVFSTFAAAFAEFRIDNVFTHSRTALGRTLVFQDMFFIFLAEGL